MFIELSLCVRLLAKNFHIIYLITSYKVQTLFPCCGACYKFQGMLKYLVQGATSEL